MLNVYDLENDENFENLVQYFQECGLEPLSVNEHAKRLVIRIAEDMFLVFSFGVKNTHDLLVTVSCYFGSSSTAWIHLGLLNWPHYKYDWKGLNSNWPKGELAYDDFKGINMSDFVKFLKTFKYGRSAKC